MFFLFLFFELLCNPKQWHTLQSDKWGHFTEDQLSWKWKFVRQRRRNASAQDFVKLQLLVLISYIKGPNFQFRCDRRGMCMRVRWWLGWQSVIWSPEMWELSPSCHWGGSSWWRWWQKSWFYFHNTDLGIASGCIDFDLLGWISYGVGGGGGSPRNPLDFEI